MTFKTAPVLLHLQLGNFYLAGGVKAGIPLSSRYSCSASMLRNSGYYSEDSYTYTTQKFMGFGTFNDIYSDGDIE